MAGGCAFFTEGKLNIIQIMLDLADCALCKHDSVIKNPDAAHVFW